METINQTEFIHTMQQIETFHVIGLDYDCKHVLTLKREIEALPTLKHDKRTLISITNHKLTTINNQRHKISYHFTLTTKFYKDGNIYYIKDGGTTLILFVETLQLNLTL